MIPAKSPAGRPLGSGMKDDSAELAAVADMLIAQPTMLPTTAMRRLLADKAFKTEAMEKTAIRRWQGRWKNGKGRYLEAARSRASARLAAMHTVPTKVVAGWSVFDLPDLPGLRIPLMNLPRLEVPTIMQDAEFQKRMQVAANTPVLAAMEKQMSDIANSPAVRAMQDLTNSPAFRQIQANARG
jgi:hypothetical protein